MNKLIEPPKKCFICGKKDNLIKTECCNQWICNDESDYVLFSYSKNSCSRNHRKQTICGFHYAEGHKGKWENCKICKDIEPEFYAYYGTNEYNYMVLKDPPSFTLQNCMFCKKPVKRAEESYTMAKGGIICSTCRP